MKNIQDYFKYLYKLERTGMKYNLTNINKLCKAIGNPQNKFKSIHIAGTNGKGASASFIASALTEHGINTGLFTSPHILNFNERIRINGRCISNNYIIDFLDEYFNIINKIKPSFFEVNTAMAFKYFADKKAEAAVIECGLGGRLDSTNILNSDISVITHIGMDHMQYLGNTLNKIAKEKLGIVKPGVKTIVSDGNKDLKSLIKSHVNINDLLYLDDITHISSVSFKGRNLKFVLKTKSKKVIKFSSPLPGIYQARNIAAAYYASKEYLKKTGIGFSITKFKKGVTAIRRNTGYFGRIGEIQKRNIKYILDISHNPDGIKQTLSSLKKCKKYYDAVIFGIMSDKDSESSIKELMRYRKHIIITKPDYERATEPGILYNMAVKYRRNNQGDIMISKCVKDALIIADKKKYKNILVIGSFFLVSDVLKNLGFKNISC